MNRHLSPREIVEAAESVLPETRRRHLSSCGPCQAEVRAATATIARLSAGGEVPEPPDGFWQELQHRVRREAPAAAHPPSVFWWGWRVLAFAAPAAIALAILAPGEPSLPIVPAVVRAPAADLTWPAPAEVPGPTAVPAWSAVAELAASAAQGGDDLPATPLRSGSADVLLDELTAAERIELLRLLRAEMGGGA